MSFGTMPYGMYVSAEGAQMQSQRLEVLANNLANVNTPGFKRDVPTFQSRLAEAYAQGLAVPGQNPVDDVGGGVTWSGVVTDFSPGPIKQTEIPTDLAITGDGFFQVADRNGGRYLTRAGNFAMSPQGELITQNGQHHVLDQSGTPIVLTPELPWSISVDGFIQQDDAAIGLSVVAPKALSDLVKEGENLFRSMSDVHDVPASKRAIRQGFLELSSVSPTLETMALIETTRAFEANTKLIQHQDSMISSLIERVLQS